MLIYKNVKGNKCGTDSTFRECNTALDPTKNNGTPFLQKQRCVNLTFDEYNDKDYLNDNIFCEEFDVKLTNIKSEIKRRLKLLRDTKMIDGYQSRIPLPIYIMIAKKIEYDSNDKNANTVKVFLDELDDPEMIKNLEKLQEAFKKTSMVKYTFQGKYTVVIYIPNLMKITKGKNEVDIYGKVVLGADFKISITYFVEEITEEEDKTWEN